MISLTILFKLPAQNFLARMWYGSVSLIITPGSGSRGSIMSST